MRREDKIRMMRVASHSMDFPPRRSLASQVGGWLIFAFVLVVLLLFTAYARAGSLVVLGGIQAPVSGWTSNHDYQTFGLGLYKTIHKGRYIELEAGAVYQCYVNGTTGNLLGLDLVLTTTGRLYAGFNAGFGWLHPRQFQDVGDIPCALGGRFGPIVGFRLNRSVNAELRIDHLSAFTPHDKGRNHLVVVLKWRF